MSFPGCSVIKNPPANVGDAGDMSLIIGGEEPLEEEWQPSPVFFFLINLFFYWTSPVFLPENPMDRGVWLATVHGVKKSRTLLSPHALEARSQRDFSTLLFTAAVFTIAKRWKHPKHPLTDEWTIKCGPFIQWKIIQPLEGNSDTCYKIDGP